MQHVLDEDGEHHSHQDGILGGERGEDIRCSSHLAAATLLPPGLCTIGCNGTGRLGHGRGPPSSSKLLHSLAGVTFSNLLDLSEPQFACL